MTDVERQDDPERRGRHWHLDKSVSITHLLSTVAIAGGLFVWGANMDNRVSLLEQNSSFAAQTVAATVQQINQLNTANTNLRLEIKDDLKDVQNKLDKLLLRPL